MKNLTFIYNEGTVFAKKALDNINLDIEKGEFIGLIGHTGSGKSTLIQHLNGLVKPTDGQVLIDGENIHEDKTRLKFFRQKVGLVFQYPEHQLFEMTVMKDVCFGPKNLGLSESEAIERAKEALKSVGIGEQEYEKSPFELSGGQKRRVAIAGVLAMKPEILVLDEPTAGLDPRGRDEILSEISKLHREMGITIILVSHSMEDISKLVDRIIVMNKSKVEMEGNCAQVFKKAKRLEEIGLAAPQICYVLDGLRDKGYPVPYVYTAEEAAKCLFELYKKRKGE